MENARLITETREALDQQTATAEVLGVINSSPGDLTPVFDAMLDKAIRLCEAAFGTLWTCDGESFQPVALRRVPPAFAELLSQGPYRPEPDSTHERLLRGAPVVEIDDIAREPPVGPVRRALVELGGARTLIAVPLRKDGVVLGVITAYRQEVRPFTDKQIALLQNFAAQAVIAMENARLITETREALEQQTATAEVLGVINSSPGDLAPVFDAMLEKATRLCDASYGLLATYDAEGFRGVAAIGLPMESANALSRIGHPPSGTALGQLERTNQTAQIADILLEPAYSEVFPVNPWLRRVRTNVVVPMLKEGELIGAFILFRQEVRPFSDKQIALLQNFAAQAVIAIENARLITETREALEQQTATAEVLQVINSSPGDLAPVFDAILEKAHSLCGTAIGSLVTYDGEYFQAVADHGYREEFADLVRRVFRAPPNSSQERLLRGERLVHIPDLAAVIEQGSDNWIRRAIVERAGGRTVLMVPLRRDDKLLGYISAMRREVRGFSEKEIALLENFAAQAVIAMENARLITETREALEQQTATAEVLGVINSSPGDLAPVFNAILEKAHTLCGAAHGHLTIYDGKQFRAAATHGVPEPFTELLSQPFRPGLDVARRLLAGEDLIHIPDMAALTYDPGDRIGRAAVELAGVRTLLIVPLRKDGALLGYITAHRNEVGQFTDKQITLLQNFAAQAVIAMENARLITETREALEQQTATAEVLQVINSSPGDLAPVFDAMLEKAMRLCEAAFGGLGTWQDDRFTFAAVRGISRSLREFVATNTVSPGPRSGFARVARETGYVQFADISTSKFYAAGDPLLRAMVDLDGARTTLSVPLAKDGEVLGVLTFYRREVRPFTDKQIALLQSFAAQAVIAMDNARLLNAIRQRQAELRVTFDNMGDGVAMFDSELRLAAWNMNFQRILDLPDEFLTGRPSVADFVHHLAMHGEYGVVDVEAEVRRLSERVGTQWSTERTRPGGRVIEVRNNPVPGGGFVVIYSDVTERKRAEEQIRAARDAAEKALGELKTTQASLIHAEKMASLGQLTAGIAHEIKNPLNFVNNFAGLSIELLEELKETAAPGIATLDDSTRAEVDETVEMLTSNLDKIAEHGRRADGIVKSMLEHSRGVTGERREVDLNALVEEALNLAYHGARARDASFNITLEREFDRPLAPIELAPQEMTRVFLNLIGNGFYAATERQREGAETGFRPTLTVATRDLGDAVEVRIRDNGTGIAPEIRDKLFQPFFTTKPTGEGTGLGLSISYDIVTQQHSGTIAVDSEVGEFTEFTVCLPRSRQSATAGRAA